MSKSVLSPDKANHKMPKLVLMFSTPKNPKPLGAWNYYICIRSHALDGEIDLRPCMLNFEVLVEFEV